MGRSQGSIADFERLDDRVQGSRHGMVCMQCFLVRLPLLINVLKRDLRSPEVRYAHRVDFFIHVEFSDHAGPFVRRRYVQIEVRATDFEGWMSSYAYASILCS